MLNQEEYLRLRNAYIEIGKLVQKYGYGEYDSILIILMNQIKCIDSTEADDDKLQYLVESYQSIFTSRGGLSDFVVYDKDNELRNQLNEKYTKNVDVVWKILKRYIL